MKQSRFDFGEKSIDTPYLHIENNIMTWNDNMIQLSNISCVSASDIDMLRFPLLSVGLIMLGLVLISEFTLIAMVFIAAGAAWIYLWYRENEKRKAGAKLTIRMNSGHSFYFDFEDREFLKRVVRVIDGIISDGSTGVKNVKINIHDCTISGNASILNNLRA